MNRHDHWLDVAVTVAERAGALLRTRGGGPREGRPHTVHHKGFRDIVTATDTEVEALILDHLRDAFPGHAFTSEEAGADAVQAPVRWLIDPLDGTTNFSRDNPNFSTSLAAVEGGRVVVGVVLDPLREHTFAARRGGGATCNGVPLRTSGVVEMAEAIFAVDTPRSPTRRRQMWWHVDRLLTQARTMRASGSAALDMAYVAAGWLDLYLSVSVHPWDHAAAALLVEEAGGVAGTVSGAPWTPFCRDPVMAASPTLFAGFRALVKPRVLDRARESG